MLLASKERLPVIRELDLRVLVPQRRVHARIREMPSERVPVASFPRPPQNLRDVSMRGFEVRVREHGGDAEVLRAALRGFVGVPSHGGGAERRLEETQHGFPGKAIDGPAIRLELAPKAAPLRGRHVRETRSAREGVQDLILAETRAGTSEKRRRLRDEGSPVPSFQTIERRAQGVHERPGGGVRILCRLVHVPGLPHRRSDLLRGEEEEERQAGVWRGERGLEQSGGEPAPADVRQRRFDDAPALVRGERGNVEYLEESAGSVAHGVRRATSRGGDDDARGERDGGWEPVALLDVAHVGAVQAVQEDDDLAEQSGVGEEPGERGGDVVQGAREVDVDVEPGLELGAEAEEDASEIVGLTEETEGVGEDEGVRLRGFVGVVSPGEGGDGRKRGTART